jgi:hypothetical protein
LAVSGFAYYADLAFGYPADGTGLAVRAIAVLTKRRRFWFGSLAFGLVGVFFFLWGLLMR